MYLVSNSRDGISSGSSKHSVVMPEIFKIRFVLMPLHAIIHQRVYALHTMYTHVYIQLQYYGHHWVPHCPDNRGSTVYVQYIL